VSFHCRFIYHADAVMDQYWPSLNNCNRGFFLPNGRGCLFFGGNTHQGPLLFVVRLCMGNNVYYTVRNQRQNPDVMTKGVGAGQWPA
jgi:hypothetical protein